MLMLIAFNIKWSSECTAKGFAARAISLKAPSAMYELFLRIRSFLDYIYQANLFKISSAVTGA